MVVTRDERGRIHSLHTADVPERVVTLTRDGDASPAPTCPPPAGSASVDERDLLARQPHTVWAVAEHDPEGRVIRSCVCPAYPPANTVRTVMWAFLAGLPAGA